MLRAAGKVKRGCGGVGRRQGPRWQPRMSPVSPRSEEGHERKWVEMLFAHLKASIGFDCVSFRGAKDEFLLTAIAQNLRELAKLDHPQPASEVSGVA